MKFRVVKKLKKTLDTFWMPGELLECDSPDVTERLVRLGFIEKYKEPKKSAGRPKKEF